jgi:hypothetical protein
LITLFFHCLGNIVTQRNFVICHKDYTTHKVAYDLNSPVLRIAWETSL